MCLAEIINNSSLPIKTGSALYGGIGYYAATVHTGQSRIKTCGDWVFCEAENGNALIDYAGGGECAVLPEKYRGEEYAIHSYALMLKNIRAVKMPNSVQKIGKGAFWGCTYLTDVSLPDGLKSLSENLFSRCASLEAINIPASVTSIKNFAFSLCTSLRTVEIPAGVREIGKGVFHGCRLLEDVVLPEGVDTVANMLLAQCGGLRSVTLPASVKHIGMGAFFKCYKLDEIIYRGTISQWNAIEKELDTEACSGHVRIVCADGEFTAERRFA
jgi:hypothetical protein